MPFRPEAGKASSLVTEDPCPPLKLVIMGGPGCGKGTICKAIVEKFGVVHVSVGDILRKRQHDGTNIGEQVHFFGVQCVHCFLRMKFDLSLQDAEEKAPSDLTLVLD
jgi:hypothetical protein